MPYMFNRSVQLGTGNVLDALAWAVKITEKVNTITGRENTLWSTAMSPQVGLLSWNSIADDYAELVTSYDKLMADSGYIELIEEGARYGAGQPADDLLVRIVHAEPPASPPWYASITEGRLAPGHSAEGLALGVEMSKRMTAITGRPSLFGASVTGKFGGIGFMVLADTIDEIQAANEALATDADWVKLVDEKASVAFTGDPTRSLSRRIA